MYGSLALTGRGHCTDRAMLLGLEGTGPRRSIRRSMAPTIERIRSTVADPRRRARRIVPFDEPLDLLFHRDQTLPQHPNGMRFTALDGAGDVLHREEYFSTGGGFIVRGGDFGKIRGGRTQVEVPYRSSPRRNCSGLRASTGSNCTNS